MRREYRDYINDIIDAIRKIIEFTKELTLEDFKKDDKTTFAVIRALEIIGEAVKKIPIAVKLQQKDIPWKEMAGMRDKLIHEYFGVNKKMVFKTAKEEIPKLLPLFENMKDTLKGA